MVLTAFYAVICILLLHLYSFIFVKAGSAGDDSFLCIYLLTYYKLQILINYCLVIFYFYQKRLTGHAIYSVVGTDNTHSYVLLTGLVSGFFSYPNLLLYKSLEFKNGDCLTGMVQLIDWCCMFVCLHARICGD